jgi:separase
MSVEALLKRKHTVLALDKLLQKLPIESIPLLRANSQSRVPSLQVLSSLLEKNSARIDPKSVFYILNPGGDLVTSQKNFEQDFKKWDGVSGVKPDAEKLHQSLETYDAFM